MKTSAYTIAAVVAVAWMTFVLYKRREYYQWKPTHILSPQVPPLKKPIISAPTRPLEPVPMPKIPEPPSPSTPSVYRAPLIVEIEARIGAPTHVVVSATTVKNEALKLADKVRQRVEACPNAPQLVGSPQVTVRKSGGGIFSAASYYGTVRWEATWAGEYLFDNAKACIEQAMLSLFHDARDYITSITARRG